MCDSVYGVARVDEALICRESQLVDLNTDGSSHGAHSLFLSSSAITYIVVESFGFARMFAGVTSFGCCTI